MIRSVGAEVDPASALSSVVLPEPVPPETTTLAAVGDQPSAGSASRVAGDAERVEAHAARAEAADREARAVDRERRDHRVQPGAVGQAGVDHRRRPVEPERERGEDALRRAAGSRRRRAASGTGSMRAGPLDEAAARIRSP